MVKYVLTGADGNLGGFAADYIAEVKSDNDEVVFTSYKFDGGEESDWEARGIKAKNVIQAAKETGVKRVCYTSFVGADSDKPIDEVPFLPRDHHFIEHEVYASGLDYNIQRNWLYQNNTPQFFAQSWHFTGLVNSHDVPGAYVAREECGRVFGALLLGKQEKKTVVDVTGSEPVLD
ncbi:hypothetical protein PHYPSEUDO_004957 [Phytophthora pseudosyringae]|uniref:NAD(P)-binding domain-containing protein n=1 Tax=Phytophthora pseudosyringae TaxID=221518 RepID=A0A8T1WBK5_9STRA|nr:hypothetical protein PHYPSEUDO_004957 [Phytophthora pseudosyringae]